MAHSDLPDMVVVLCVKYFENVETKKLNCVVCSLDVDEDKVQLGAPCKHNSCDTTFLGEDATHGECNFHPGYPVFHEGYVATKRSS